MQPYTIEPLLDDDSSPRRQWKPRLVAGSVCLMLLLVLGWWGLNSELFFRHYILPKANEALGGEITIESAAWSLRRSLTLHGVQLSAAGKDPCLEAKEIHVSWSSVRDLMEGRVYLDEVRLVEPVISVKMEADGRTNLDPFFKADDREAGESTRVRIGNVSIQNGAGVYKRTHASGTEEIWSVSHFDLNTAELGPDLKSETAVSAGVRYQLQSAERETSDELRGAVVLKTSQQLDNNWLPVDLSGQTTFSIQDAMGQFQFSKGLTAGVTVAYLQKQLDRFQVEFTQNRQPIGSVSAKGALEVAAGTADLALNVKGVDKRVLNFIGRTQGLDFHGTVLNSTNRLVASNFGQILKIRGGVAAAPLQVSHRRIPFPSVDSVQSTYAFNINQKMRHVQVGAWNLSAIHSDRPFLTGGLKTPMTLAWGESVQAPDSTFELRVNNTDIADWRPWIGQYARSGQVNSELTVAVKQAGREIAFTGSCGVSGLRVPVNGVEQAVGDSAISIKGKLDNFQLLQFDQCRLEMGTPEVKYFKYDGNPIVDLAASQVTSTFSTLNADLPVLMNWFPQPNIKATHGRIDYNGAVTATWSKTAKVTLAGTLDFNHVTGNIQNRQLNQLGGTLNLEGELSGGNQVRLDRFELNADAAGKPLLAKATLTGGMDVQSGAVDFRALNINGLQLELLKEIVPLGSLQGGAASANLKSLKFAPDDAGSINGSVTVLNGQLDGWPVDLNATLAGSAILARSPAGEQSWAFSEINLSSFSGTPQSVPTAVIRGRAEMIPRTGAFQATIDSSRITAAFLRPLLADHLDPVRLDRAVITPPQPMQIAFDGNGKFTLKGRLDFTDVRLSAPAARADLFPRESIGAGAELELVYHQEKNQWKLDVDTTKIAFTVGPRAAGILDLKGNFDSSTTQGQFKADLQKVDHWVLNLLPDSWRGQMELTSGRVDSLTASGTMAAGKLHGTVGLDMSQAKLSGDKVWWWPTDAVDVSQQLEGEITWGKQGGVNLTRNQGIVKKGERVLAAYDGSSRFQPSEFSFKFKSVRLEPEFSGLIVNHWFPGRLNQMGIINATNVVASRLTNGTGKLSGGVTLAGFSLAPRVAGEPVHALDSSFVVEASAEQGAQYAVRKFEAQLPGGTQATVAGTLDLKNLMAPSGKILVQSKKLDITPLMAFLDVSPNPNESEVGPDGTGAPQFAFRNFDFGLDVGHVDWADLNATNVKGTVRLNGNQIGFHPLELNLLGSPVMLQGTLKPAHAGQTEYDLQFTCQSLPLDPIVRHFVPDHTIQWGFLSANFEAKAAASSGPDFRRTFTAHGIDPQSPAWIGIAGSHWGFKKDDPIAGFIASPVILNLPELLESHFDGAGLRMYAGQGQANFRLEAKGPLMTAAAGGTAQLADRWLDSTVDEDIDIQFAPPLANKFKPLNFVLKENQFWQPPSFLTLSGPIRRPMPTVDPVVVTRLGAQALLGRPGSILQSIPIPLFNTPKDKDKEGSLNPLNPFDLLRTVIPGID